MLNAVYNLFLWLFGLAPSNSGLQELNNQLRYGQYHLPMGVDGLASLAPPFHFSPPEVMAAPPYRAWMAELGPAVTHVLINSDSTDLGLPDVSVHQHKLRRIRPDLFPALAGAGDFEGSPSELPAALDRRAALGLPDTGPVLQARTGLRVEVRPWGGGAPGLDMVQF